MHVLFIFVNEQFRCGPYGNGTADESQPRYDAGDVSGVAVIGAGLIPQDQKIHQSTGGSGLCQLIQKCQQGILDHVTHQNKHQERIHHGPDSLVHGIFLFGIGIAVSQFFAAAEEEFLQFVDGLHDIVCFGFL